MAGGFALGIQWGPIGLAWAWLGGMTILLAEQSVELALEFAQQATVLQVGRSVLAGTAGELAENPEVQRVYMGL